MVYFQLFAGAVASAAALLTVTQAAPAISNELVEYQKALTGDMYSSVFSLDAEMVNSCPVAETATSAHAQRTPVKAIVNFVNVPKEKLACHQTRANIIASESQQLKDSDIKNAQATLKDLDAFLAGQLKVFEKENLTMSTEQTNAFKGVAKPFLSDYLTILGDPTLSGEQRGSQLTAFAERTDIVDKFHDFATQNFGGDRASSTDVSVVQKRSYQSFKDAMSRALSNPGKLALSAVIFAAEAVLSIVFYPVQVLLCIHMTKAIMGPQGRIEECFIPFLLMIKGLNE